jgi:hypothetical protein
MEKFDPWIENLTNMKTYPLFLIIPQTIKFPLFMPKPLFIKFWVKGNQTNHNFQ